MKPIRNTFTPNALDRIDKLKHQSSRSAMNAAVRVMENSVNRTPEDTGELKASSYVEKDGDKVKFGYDDEKAIYVHERTDQRHEVGEAKFLRNAMSWWLFKGKEEMARELNTALTKGQVSSELSYTTKGGAR